MNKQRKKEIEEIRIQLFALNKQLKRLLDQEQDVFDNMPEGIQESVRGEESEDAINYLDETIEHIDDAITNLGDIL